MLFVCQKQKKEIVIKNIGARLCKFHYSGAFEFTYLLILPSKGAVSRIGINRTLNWRRESGSGFWRGGGGEGW